jgi:hypothetical protein
MAQRSLIVTCPSCMRRRRCRVKRWRRTSFTRSTFWEVRPWNPIPTRDAAGLVMGAMEKRVEAVEKQALRPAQTIGHRLAERHGYRAPSTAECLQRFVEGSLSLSPA